ncbi:hypothetical protein EV426DRAFT_676005 [Tirmania nivea]|nr:hypothetical protein EV426DRAFT_676005 [Tirmania nivea]
MRGKLPPLLAAIVGVATGVYTFQPLLAQDAREKQKRCAAADEMPGAPAQKDGYGGGGGVGRPARAVVVEVAQPTEAEADAEDGGLWERVVRRG